MKALLLLLALLFLPALAEATTWYAGTGGTGVNCTQYQTQATRAPTIAAGLACMAAAGGGGHTLVIQAGTYTDTGLVVPSGTALAHNTVRSDTTGTVTFTSQGSFNLYSSNVSYVDFVGNRTTPNMIWDGTALGLGDFSAFAICQASRHAGCPGENHSISFDGVRVHHWGYTAIYTNSANNTFKYSRFDNNGLWVNTIGQSGYAFYISGGSDNNIIEYSEIDLQGGYGVHIYSGYAEAATNNIVRYNRIHENGQTGATTSAFGIMLGGGANGGGSPAGVGNQVYGNVIYGERNGNIAVSYNCVDCIVYNNTLYGTSGVGLQINSATGTLVRNNIMSNNGTNIVNTGAATTFQTNLCSSTGTGCDPALVESASTTFVNPGSDFHLRDTATAAVNGGANLGPPYNLDIAGATRPVTGPWELGAYEYGAPITPPSPQLVLALPLDEGSGSIATDVSGQKNNATLIGGATWTSSRTGFGQAIQLDGTGYLNIPASASLALAAGMTLEAWIYPIVVFSSFSAVIRHDLYYLYAGIAAGYYCPSPATAPWGGYSSASGINAICATSLPPINTWSHLAMTYDGYTLVFYLNGNPIASQPSVEPMISGTATVSVGASTFGVVGDHFIGRIDQPMIYNYARTPAQINGDMNTALIGPPGKYVEIAAPASVEISAASSIEIAAD